MKVSEIQAMIEAWAPPAIAWKGDNVGLQCGDPDARVSRIMVVLDVTEEVIHEAVRKHVTLLISHHPLLFRPVSAVSPQTAEGRAVRALVRHDISLISAHTNLDFTRGGTSFALASALGLEHQEFLHRPAGDVRKIVTFVPADRAEAVADAMAAAGAGTIGNYDLCSFRSEGIGTFRGNAASHPAVGSPLTLERVPEIRIEMALPHWKIPGIIQALRAAHPYEEPAYDIFATEAPDDTHGMGVLGDLHAPLRLRAFLAFVKRRLGTGALRYAQGPHDRISRVAVCGGSGAELLQAAVSRGADAFVTADTKYHVFHEAAGTITLVDAGHFETEFPVVPALVARLQKELHRLAKRIPVSAAATKTNPVRYV